MMSSDNPSRNKILVVGRRGVGKLSLVQSILGSRFVPTTSVSKSRPSSPLILPAIPVPTIEETIVEEHGALSQGFSAHTPPNHADDQSDPMSTSMPSSLSSMSLSSSSQNTQEGSSQEQQRPQKQQQQQQDSQDSQNSTPESSFPAGSQFTQGRPKLDHSGVTIPWTIDTKYYSVQVDFWIDETEAQGRAEVERLIVSGELDEMGAVIEAVIFCFSKNEPSTFHDIKPWLTFVERFEPSITLCVATGAPRTQEMMQESHVNNEIIGDYDDWCLGNGFEYIDLQDQPSDLTQDEHVGLDRIMEALAAHMWDGLKRKSNKKRDQHERSMMMSFHDDDMDLTYDSSCRDNGPRRSLAGFDPANLSKLHEGMLDHEDDGDDDEDDVDDDRAFYDALAELNLHNRSKSPTAPGHGPGILTQTMGAFSESQQDKKSSASTHGFDDDFDLDEQEIKALENDDMEFWSSQESSRSVDVDRTLERQFKKFLGHSLDDSVTTSSEAGGKESSGELDDFSFELNANGDDEFEFGDYVVSAAGPGGEELRDFADLNLDEGISTPNQESIKSMHQALFASIDEDEGMAQTIATLQGLREQGKSMSEHDRRELAARVALSFGMQMGE